MKSSPSPPGSGKVLSMNATELQHLRLGSPGSPSVSEVAERMDCAHSVVSRFETGQAMLSEEMLRLYAKAVRSTVSEVRRRYLASRLAWLERELRAARAELLEHGQSGRRRGPKVGAVAD